MIKFSNSKFLIFIFFLTIFVIYFFNISDNKGVILTTKSNKETSSPDKSTVFSNVQYNFTTPNGHKYTLIGNKAFINNNDLELVNIMGVRASTILNDKSVLNIESKYSDFYKLKKDIFFYEDFVLKNKDTIITANNANYLFKKNTIKIFNNVILQNGKNLIKCDNLIYYLNTKKIELTMNSKNSQVYGKKKN